MNDDFLMRHTPGPTLEIASSILGARRALAEATPDWLAVPDSALESAWPWRGEQADVRYGLYRPLEAIEAAGAEVARVLRDTGARRTPAADLIAPVTAARWDLHGLLATVPEAILDTSPGEGDWSARETLGHIVGGQRAYGWYTAWWATRDQSQPPPSRVPEAVVNEEPLPDEVIEAAGTVADVRERFDEIVDLSGGRLAYLEDDGLALPAAWSGVPVNVGFRLGRWSSHVIEHTLQLDKIMVALDRRPTEVERLVRLVHAAYGRLEALVFPMATETLARSDERGRSADAVLATLAGELVSDARSVRAAAGT